MDSHYIIAAKSDIGNYKEVNQDSLTVKVAKTPKGEVAFAVLCDGMGGLSFGEVASAHVVRAFHGWFSQRLKSWIEDGMEKNVLLKEWTTIISECNRQIVNYGDKEKVKLGTTLTVMLLIQNNFYIAHVGDCRAYQLGKGICQITKDQTFVAREVELGHMTETEAKNDSRKNVLLQCIGVNNAVAPDFYTGRANKNDTFLLCSDGFRHELSEDEIYRHTKVLLDGYTLDNKLRDEIHLEMNKQLEYLIELNKKRGEKDNISAILIKCC